MIVSYSRVCHNENLLLGNFFTIYVTIKWLEARDFALHILARFLATLEYLERLLIALLLSSMRRSQSDATNVHSKIGLATNVCRRELEIQNKIY